MANYFFPEAFKQNAIQSFIDGKLAAIERTRKERERQQEMYFKYQDFLMKKARHDQGLAKAKLELERLKLGNETARTSAAQARAFDARMQSGYGRSYSGQSSTNPYFSGDIPAGYDGPVYRTTEGGGYSLSSGDPFEARYGKPSYLGGPKADPGFDQFGAPLAPKSKSINTYRGPAMNSPEPMSFEDAVAKGIINPADYATTPGEALAARRDAYLSGRQQPTPYSPARPAAVAQDNPFAASPYAPTRRRYDPNNTANDEFMLNFLGGF